MSDNSSAPVATAALITGIVAFVLTLVFFLTPAGAIVLALATITGVVAIILSIIALRRKQKKGFAVTGLVLGIISVVAAAAIYVFALLFIGAFTTG